VSLILFAAACSASSPSERSPDDDGRCPTARGNDQLRGERQVYEQMEAQMPPPPPVEVFNRAAEELGLPFRWGGDANKDGRVNPDEVMFGNDTDGNGRVETAEIEGPMIGASTQWVMMPMDVNVPSTTAFFTQAFVKAYSLVLKHPNADADAAAGDASP
jgi:hypothetical protein